MISVVIPSYSRKDCVIRLLGDLRKQRGVDFETILVDDASPDGTVDLVRDEFPEVRLIENEVNGGPAVSRNRGVKAAKGEIIVGFDSDVSLPDDTLLARVKTAFEQRPDTTGIAFRIFKPDGLEDDTERWWHPVPVKMGAQRHFETDYFSGTAYAFRREPMIAAGLFPEILYMHYEEVELAFRILDNGGTISYNPELGVVHHANPVSRRSEILVYYKPRNQLLLALSCFPVFAGIRYAIPRLTYQFGKAINGGHIDDFARAVRDAFCKTLQEEFRRQPLKAATIRRINLLKKN